MNIDNKELALFWYYNIKDTFPKEDIDSDVELKEQYVVIKNHLRKMHGKIDDLSPGGVVEIKLKVPKKYFGIDYKNYIEKLDLSIFKRLYDEKTKKYYEYIQYMQTQDAHNKVPIFESTDEIKGLKVIYIRPNEFEIGELYKVLLEGKKRGIEEAINGISEIDTLIQEIKPDFDISLKGFVESIKKEEDKNKQTSTKPSIEWKNYIVQFMKAGNSMPFVKINSPNITDDSFKHPYNLGLYKSQSEPTVVYEMLLWFAKKGRTLNPRDFPNIKQNAFSQRIKRCNEWLMERFNLKEKPIRRYSKTRVGYTSRINITIEERKKGKDSLDLTDLNYDNPDPKEDQEVNNLFSDIEEDNKLKNSYDDNFDDSDSGDYD